MMPSMALLAQLRQRPTSPGLTPGVGQPRVMSAPAPGQPQPPQSPFGGWVGALHNKLLTNSAKNDVNLPYFEEDRQRLGGMLDGHSPFAGQEWGSSIKHLQGIVDGTGPSLAEQQYRAASQDNVNALSSMSRGSGSAAAGRQALIQQGRVGQGMAAGVAQARTNEQMQASSALTQALSSRDSLNQNAYLDLLAKQLGLSRDQMQALAGNRDAATARNVAKKQADAAKMNAIGGGLGMLGGLF